MWGADCCIVCFFFFFFSSRRRHTRCREVSWARRCVQETDIKQSRYSCQESNHRTSYVNPVNNIIVFINIVQELLVAPIFRYSSIYIAKEEPALFFTNSRAIKLFLEHPQEAKNCFRDCGSIDRGGALCHHRGSC
eukprot:TRINITY_DN1822_c0_g1_i4.p4 TRINITY_DN1822_c0_g1~~TRINITY_DN1822_c0_g1_i4.p4  ORF type:complete len:135 (+),score=21.62 TRINITY_DN1822_c0_g1_i4:92-496(+)